MNAEEAKKFLPIIEAFAKGNKIQWRDQRVCWMDIENPSFAAAFEYRIKPEPRELWINIDNRDGSITTASFSREKVEGLAAELGNRTTHKFVEVL